MPSRPQQQPRARVSRREFARLGASAGSAIGIAALSGLALDAQQTPAPAGRGAAVAATPPEALKSEFLMDLILETSAAARIGNRGITPVTGGTFEGPRLKGKVLTPGADWTMRVNDQLTALDVRILLSTDDDQKIYCSYRGMIARPPTGQPGGTYWRVMPVFETEAPKYDWLNRIVTIGVNYTVPMRIAYRFFQIL